MRQMVAIPTGEGFVGRVTEEDFQGGGVNVSVAEQHIYLIVMPRARATEVVRQIAHKGKGIALADDHHFSGHSDFRFSDRQAGL